MANIVGFLNGLIWSPVLVYGCLAAGVWFTLRTRGVQFRMVGEMVRLIFKGKSSAYGISSFQALAVSIAGRVGSGNLAGVAVAIAAGGPGAVVWMWIIAFLGAASAFVESVLGQIYKEKDYNTQEYRGGPAYYIEKGFKHKGFAKVYALIFAISTIVATGFFLPGIQANTIVIGLENSFGLSSLVTGLALAGLVAIIIWGGIRRIAHVAEFVVPFMAIIYILVAIIVIIINFKQIPEIFGLMISSAFGANAAFGGILGSAISWGVKRGVYSNEAGQGTGPHAAAAAEVSHPAKQGLVQAFSVYIDTLFVCSATAFIILSTGAYNVLGSDGSYIVENLQGVDAGVGFLQEGLAGIFHPGLARGFIGIIIFFFAFTTIMAYYYQAETNIAYINNRHGHRRYIIHIARVFLVVSIFLGTQLSSGSAWALGDIGVGLMAWINIIAILILQKPAIIALKDYEKKLKANKTSEAFDVNLIRTDDEQELLAFEEEI